MTLTPPPLSNDCFALPQGVNWTPVDEALTLLRGRLGPVTGAEAVSLSEALGRVLAEDAIALRSNPPQPNTAVDGYGFAGGRPEGAHVMPLVAGRAAAGVPFNGVVPPGQAIRILTGAALPEGVDTGTRLRLSGKGGAGQRNAPAGDVYVEIRVREDERYQRVGDDLHHRVRVGFTEATFGTDIEVPLLEGGTEELEIPRGTQPETVYRLARKGVPRLQRRGRGDLLVHIEVAVPADLTEEEEDALRAYAELRGERPASKKRGLFRR